MFIAHTHWSMFSCWFWSTSTLPAYNFYLYICTWYEFKVTVCIMVLLCKWRLRYGIQVSATLNKKYSLNNRIYIITASFKISNNYKRQLTLTSVAAEHILLLSKHAQHMKLLDSENSDTQGFMCIFKSKNIYSITLVLCWYTLLGFAT